MNQAQVNRVANQIFRQAGVSGPNIHGTGTSRGRVGEPAVKVQAGVDEGEVPYSEQEYFSGGDTYFGLGRTNIPAGTVVPVKKNPIRPFKPLEFRSISAVQGLVIVQIDIRGTQFFANNGDIADGMPIELFSEVSYMEGLLWNTIHTDTGVTISVGNPTGGDLIFAAGFQGVQLRD